MIEYGFFNSVDGDRLYNAESFNKFFEGLISANGIFENVEGGLAVSPGTALTVSVATGKAMVNSCWVKNDSVESLTIATAHNLLNRYDMVTLRYNSTARNVTLQVTTGTPAATPVKPNPVRNTTTYEIALAYVHIKANATAITAADIQDCRYDTNLCGVITGLIKQVDTTTLYNQYLAQFNQLKTELEAWEVQQKAQFTEWLNALTQELNVNTYIVRNISTIITSQDGTNYIDLPDDLGYTDGDILQVFVGGVLFVEGLDYDMRINEVTNKPMIYIYYDLTKNNPVTFYNFKSKIGWNTTT